MSVDAGSGDEFVWYAAYGSNLSEARFGCYLEGGRPPGATRTYEPCPDGVAPFDTRPIRIDRPLAFGRRSATWDGGGVAFVGHQRGTEAVTYGRAYLLTVGQLLHVARQENRHPEPLPPMARAELVERDRFALPLPPASFYRVVLMLGELDHRPILTLTGAAGPVPHHPPSLAYRQTVVRGLHETWPELTMADIDDYLTAAGAPPPGG